MIATRVAAELKREPDVTVESVRGGLGELSVDVDGERIFTANRLGYPTPGKVIRKVKAALA